MLLTRVLGCVLHPVKALVFCLTIVVFAACCGLADQSPSSLKQCKDLFKADKFGLLLEKNNEIYYQDEAPNEASCRIADAAAGESLVIKFKMLFMVSGVLIDETTFGNAIGAVKVLLWSGSHSTECNLDRDVDVVELSDGRRLVKFLCYHSGGIAGPANDKNVVANQIEITSITPVTMNLTKIKSDLSLGFITRELIGVDENNRNDPGGCEPPPLYDDQFAKPEKNYYMPMEKVCICCKNKDGASASQHAHYTCQTNGSWSYDDRPLSKCNSQSSLMDAITRKPIEDNHYQALLCPPFEAYDGMPHNYTNYAYTVDRSINEKLFNFPCREGYEFVGNRSDINQCNKNGTWQGKGFPVCHAVTFKVPPEVENGDWVVEKNGTALRAIYTCRFFYYLNGSGNASYSHPREEWITNAPECLLDLKYVILTAIFAFILFVFIVAVFSKCWNMIMERLERSGCVVWNRHDLVPTNNR